MVIQIDHFSKTINKSPVLSDIHLTMESGHIYGLKGKNGSGKTMLMRGICGLINATSGSIRIDGEVLGRELSFPRSVGALIENPGFIAGYSGIKNLRVLASINRTVSEQTLRDTLELVGLDPDEKKAFKKYSLGMKQKLGIAAAIMENPELIILDEPFNALDEKSARRIRDLLLTYRAAGKLTVIACHDSEELDSLSDRVFCMEEGKIVREYEPAESTPAESEAR